MENLIGFKNGIDIASVDEKNFIAIKVSALITTELLRKLNSI